VKPRTNKSQKITTVQASIQANNHIGLVFSPPSEMAVIEGILSAVGVSPPAPTCNCPPGLPAGFDSLSTREQARWLVQYLESLIGGPGGTGLPTRFRRVFPPSAQRIFVHQPAWARKWITQPKLMVLHADPFALLIGVEEKLRN
jgi:hypothetical protein